MKLESRKALSVLMEEIESVGEENICINVIVTITSTNNASSNLNASTNDTNIVIGVARVPLITMIENNCNIFRHVSIGVF